jgi:hypothetical protein
MTGRQKYDRTKDRQRTLDKYMINWRTSTTTSWTLLYSLSGKQIKAIRATELEFLKSLWGLGTEEE